MEKYNFQQDYEPLRLGLKPQKMLIVLEFQTPSNNKKFQHFINVSKYINANMTLTKSNSGSFKELLRAEVRKVTEAIYQDSKHKGYLDHPILSREMHIQKLVRQLLAAKF